MRRDCLFVVMRVWDVGVFDAGDIVGGMCRCVMCQPKAGNGKRQQEDDPCADRNRVPEEDVC